MQEVFKNGTEGEIITADTLEDLIPQIKKSLENPSVKYVKIFNAENKINSQEKRKDILEELYPDRLEGKD